TMRLPWGQPDASDRHVALFHAVFLVLAALALLAPTEGPPLHLPLGWVVAASVLAYNLALPILAARWVHPRWIRIWVFLLPLSILQILPDAFLARQLGVLEFADLGAPRIGGVAAYMALMWIVPLFLVVYVGERIAERRSVEAALPWVAGIALLLFAGAEATLTRIPIWEAHGVTLVGPVALYVLVPELLLGVAAFLAWHLAGRRGLATRLAAAFAVMTFYLGALALSYLLIETGLGSQPTPPGPGGL
ncbi:MAG: hypothetical protein MI919_36215, partial [Holophagales bacterium]|nr:hypothetical protein [Holophagales bacterium]